MKADFTARIHDVAKNIDGRNAVKRSIGKHMNTNGWDLQDWQCRLSRRQMLSGLAGLATSAVAAEAGAQPAPSPVMRPQAGEALIYDDFSAGVWPSPRWMKFRSAEYDLWDPETKILTP